jgi:alanine racemase
MTDRIELDLDAFRSNVRALAALVAPARTMLAVKADAYGHGMLPFAVAALESGADSLAVLEVPAALALRDAGIDAQLFAWLHGADTDFGAAVRAGIDLGVSSAVELERVAEAAAGVGRAADIHLKIDTGLHRNGASPEEWPALVSAALAHAAHGRVRIAGLWSHLADASPDDDAQALAEFHAAVAVARALGVPADGTEAPLLHIAASSAAIRMPEARLDLVRIGIAAYGVSPFEDVDARGLGLRGVMTLRATGHRNTTMDVAIDIGSADGFPIPQFTGEVLLNGERHLVGIVGVNATTVDVEPDYPARAPYEVTVFGPGDSGEPTAEEWAAWAGTIGDEILARASHRIPRVYLNE